MLRQALFDAEARQKKKKLEQQQQQQQRNAGDGAAGESTSLFATASPTDTRRADIGAAPIASTVGQGYGTTEGGIEEADAQSGSTDDEGTHDYLSHDEEDDDKSVDEQAGVPSIFVKLWDGIKTLVRVVANVENLWDSPPPPTLANSYSQTATSLEHRRHRRNQYVVLFWFVVLASSYAGERSTFKLLVDRAGPFRLFSVQMITCSHAILLGCGLVVRYYVWMRRPQSDRQRFKPLGIPLVDSLIMALLDTVTLVLVFLTGAHVPPTLTVILVQFTIPLAAFLTQFMHPDGRWTCCRPENSETSRDTDNDEDRNPLVQSGNGASSPHPFDNNPRDYHNDDIDSLRDAAGVPTGDEPLPRWGGLAAAHVWGSLILLAAVALALCPALYSIANPEFFNYADAIPMRTALNTLFFVSSCIPAAASQLYKEHTFLQYKQPVNMDYLNLLLSIFQFIFASIASPLVYGLQGLGALGDWTKLYPASDFSENFLDGVKCFFSVLDKDDQENKYPEEAVCQFTFGLVLLHVFSIIAVGVAVDKIVNAGATKVMYRGISAGIIVAVLSMHCYDMHSSEFNYGPAIDALNLVCLVLLILGSEVYHRASLQGSTFETVYPEISVPTFDD